MVLSLGDLLTSIWLVYELYFLWYKYFLILIRDLLRWNFVLLGYFSPSSYSSWRVFRSLVQWYHRAISYRGHSMYIKVPLGCPAKHPFSYWLIRLFVWVELLNDSKGVSKEWKVGLWSCPVHGFDVLYDDRPIMRRWEWK